MAQRPEDILKALSVESPRTLSRDLELWFTEKARQSCSQPGCGGNVKEVASC